MIRFENTFGAMFDHSSMQNRIIDILGILPSSVQRLLIGFKLETDKAIAECGCRFYLTISVDFNVCLE